MKVDFKAPKSHQSRIGSFKSKVSAVFNKLDIPISVYAATEKDIYRKPRPGMWLELLKDNDIHLPGDLDLEKSIFVGDAGGRDAADGKPKDFSCSDRYDLSLSPLIVTDTDQEFRGECWHPIFYSRGVFSSGGTETVHAHA